MTPAVAAVAGVVDSLGRLAVSAFPVRKVLALGGTPVTLCRFCTEDGVYHYLSDCPSCGTPYEKTIQE